MPEHSFEDTDLTGARFRKVRLTDARFRMVDLGGASLRDVSLAGASVWGSDTDGLLIDGVDVTPLVAAELNRRHPERAWRDATTPEEMRAAWDRIQQAWAGTCERGAAHADASVDGEWSLAQTLRHLVYATDRWLGAARGETTYHPWGVPFTEIAEFADPAALGIDMDATPSYAEVLRMRADRAGQVSAFLASATPELLAAEVPGPDADYGTLTVLRCLRVIFNEECEHRLFAERDLATLAP